MLHSKANLAEHIRVINAYIFLQMDYTLILICWSCVKKISIWRKDTIINPGIIVEVLSASTSAYDRGEKFHFYRSILSLKEYVLIDSLSIAAEVFRKSDEGIWFLASEAYSIDGAIELGTIDLRLNMADIYADTEDLLAIWKLFFSRN